MKENKEVSPTEVNVPLEEVKQVSNASVDNNHTSSSSSGPMPRLSDADRMELELSKMRRKLAIAEAEKALSESNRVELEYKYIVLQIYMKYSLTAQDAIDEQGNIIFGGAKQK